MVDILIVFFCVCCITIMLMCGTSVVYMIRDMVVDSRADEDESIDNDNADGGFVEDSEDATDED